MMVMFVLEDQYHLKILVHCELMEHRLMMVKMLVNPNVEMVLDIHLKSEMIVMMIQQLMDVPSHVILMMDMLVQEDQPQEETPALFVCQ